MFTVVVFLLTISVKCAIGANILFISPLPSPSHHIWNRALAFGLVERGHNVTLFGPDKDEINLANYSHIYMEGVYEEFNTVMDMNKMATYSPFQMLYEYKEWSLFMCDLVLKSEGLQQLLNYPLNFKFDLIVIDITGDRCLYPLIHRFNYPPTIAVTAFLLPTSVSYNFGNQLNPSYIPWYGLQYTADMSFIERVWNYIFTYGDIYIRHSLSYEKEHVMIEKIFGNEVPSLENLERHISLVLTNTDPLLDNPQPLTPNLIPVGGLHTKKSKKLPLDLQNLLDNALHGVIVFSLGTNIRSDKLDKKTQKELLDAFGKISETIIWKFESEIEDLPKNVIIKKWLPQNDVLGHPNVKLFIGHGGALSTQEAIFHGVPMICIPFFGDQHINTKMVVDKKLGLYVDFKSITAKYMLKNLEEVLSNSVYSKNMKELSSTFRDRPETPLERGIFWTEYVLRHGGAHFLNTPARDFPFYKSSGLDVLIFLILIIVIFVTLLSKLLCFVLTAICNRNKKKAKIH